MSVAVLAGISAAASPCQDVAQFRLESGVDVRIERVPGATAMGLFVFVKSGYDDDPAGKTGIAHLVEHMAMTAATPARKAVWTYARWNRDRIAANAMTRSTWTVYYTIGKRDDLSVDARRFADVLAGKAELDAKLLAYERPRMLREVVRMTRSVPGGVLMWRARELALAGKAARPGIGVEAEVGRLTLADVQHHYRAHHRPENALVIAVGQVDPKLDRPFYEEVFGHIKGAEVEAGSASVRSPQVEKPAPVQVHQSVGGVFGTWAFRAPPVDSDAYPAFLLGGLWLCMRAQASFRFRGREGMGFFMPGLYAFLEDPRLLFINRRGKDGESLEALQTEVTAWIEKTTQARFREAFLQMPRIQIRNLLDPLPRDRVRARLLARQPRMLYNVGLARGAAQLNGFPADLWDRIAQTKAEAVGALIRKRFQPKEAVFLALTPKRK